MAARATLRTFGLGCALSATTSLGVAQWGASLEGASAVDARVYEARGTIERDRARKSVLEAELEAIGPRKTELKQRALRDGRSLYRVSRGGLLPIAGGLDALLGHASRIGRLERIVSSEVRQLEDLDRKGLMMRKELAEIDLRVSAAERELGTLEQARVGLAQQRAAQAMFESAFSESEPRASDSRIQYGLSIVGGVVTERFHDQRGNLALPVSGPTSIGDAKRAESDGLGLEFGTSGTSAVRAAAAGRVAFAERYGSYGELVIIDHGDRYYTVYGGLGRIEVQVGDDLSKSARLGTSNAGGAVYFEVRRGTKTQDARSFLGL